MSAPVVTPVQVALRGPVPAPAGLACALCWQDAAVIDPATGAALCVPCQDEAARPGVLVPVA